MTPITIDRADARYQASLRERFGSDAPAQLTALGDLALLALPKTGLFCSARCPGDVILPTLTGQAARFGTTPAAASSAASIRRWKRNVSICSARHSAGGDLPGPQPARDGSSPPHGKRRSWRAACSCYPRLPGSIAGLPQNLPASGTDSWPKLPKEIFVAHATPGSKTSGLPGASGSRPSHLHVRPSLQRALGRPRGTARGPGRFARDNTRRLAADPR